MEPLSDFDTNKIAALVTAVSFLVAYAVAKYKDKQLEKRENDDR